MRCVPSSTQHRTAIAELNRAVWCAELKLSPILKGTGLWMSQERRDAFNLHNPDTLRFSWVRGVCMTPASPICQQLAMRLPDYMSAEAWRSLNQANGRNL